MAGSWRDACRSRLGRQRWWPATGTRRGTTTTSRESWRSAMSASSAPHRSSERLRGTRVSASSATPTLVRCSQPRSSGLPHCTSNRGCSSSARRALVLYYRAFGEMLVCEMLELTPERLVFRACAHFATLLEHELAASCGDVAGASVAAACPQPPWPVRGRCEAGATRAAAGRPGAGRHSGLRRSVGES